MSLKKELKKEDLEKIVGGTGDTKMVEIPYDIKCSHCDYVGHMTYEEGTEQGWKRMVNAYCPKCHQTTVVGLGAI